MEKGKSIVRVSPTSLEKVNKQIFIVEKILSKRQGRILAKINTPKVIFDEVRLLPTRSTPEVILVPDGIIKIRGRSIPEDALSFFKPIQEWINKYVENPADVTCVDVILEFINGASQKFLLIIFQKITYVKLKHKKVIFNWYYENGDEAILEFGEYFASVLDIPFNFIKLI
jgi:hypothetical protein